MKRILKWGRRICLLCGISVFFTGCSQKKDDFVIPYPETGQDISSREAVPGITMTGEAAKKPDIDGVLGNETDNIRRGRFDEVTGKRAFLFPENHSLDDMEQFQVLGLEKGCFYYTYITTEEGRDPDTQVLVVAKNSYEDGSYRELYKKNRLAAGDNIDDLAFSFYCQMGSNKKGESVLSIYDNGDLILLNTDGEVLFTRISEDSGESMTELIDRIFKVGGTDSKYFGREVSNVITDGRYNFYIPVNLFKEDYRELDETQDFDLESYVLVYSYIPIGDSDDAAGEHLLQYNLNYEKQAAYWQELAEDGDSERDPEADWERVLARYPDEWGDYLVSLGADSLLKFPLWKWKDGERHFSRAGMSRTAVLEGNKEAIKLLEENQRLDGYFFTDFKNGYCSLLGSTANTNLLQEEIARSYEVTTGEGENRSRTNHTETCYINYQRKTYFAQPSAIEKYVVRENQLTESMILWDNVFSGTPEADGGFSIGFHGQNLYQILTYDQGADQATENSGFLQSTDFAGENIVVRILNALKGEPCVMFYNIEDDIIRISMGAGMGAASIILNSSDLNPSGYRKGEADGELLDGMVRSGENRQREEGITGQYDIESVNLLGSPERYGAENVLVLSSSRLLFTTFHNGMQLLEANTDGGSDGISRSGRVSRISEWPLYQAWETSPGVITAIGFDREKDGFLSTDITRARVYTFNLEAAQAEASTYKIPRDDNGEEQEKAKLPTLPQEMQQYWEDAEQRLDESKNSETDPDNSTEPATLPSVTVYETDEVLGELWGERRTTSFSSDKEEHADE